METPLLDPYKKYNFVVGQFIRNAFHSHPYGRGTYLVMSDGELTWSLSRRTLVLLATRSHVIAMRTCVGLVYYVRCMP